MSRSVGVDHIADLLRRSKRFATVSTERKHHATAPTPYARVYATRWTTDRQAQGGATESGERTVTFEVAITAREGEGWRLDRLCDLVEQLLHGQAIAASYPALTIVESGRYDDRVQRGTMDYSAETAIIAGSFTFGLPPALIESTDELPPLSVPLVDPWPVWWPGSTAWPL